MVIGSFYKKYSLAAIFVFVLCSNSFAQNKEDLHFIITHNLLTRSAVQESHSQATMQTSEIKIFCLGMIRIYQLFVSSQQNNQSICTFIPSCSHFGYQAISEYGTFWGILMTADRLQRCHGFPVKYYTLNPLTGKFQDPIYPYHINRSSSCE